MIKLKEVYYTYNNGNNALKNINLKIKSGETTLIIGRNGSGKSTLANVISNIFECTKGNISIDELEINKYTKSIDIRKKVNIVFQNPSNQIIFNRVYDDIAFTLNNLKFEKDKIGEIIKESLKKVGMSDYIYSNPFELSLGQRQKIAVANILAIKPKYIVFDESTSMLDSSSKKDIYDLIKNLVKENIGVVFVTNNLEELLIADRIVVIDNGEIVKEFLKKDLLNNIDYLTKLNFIIPFIVKIIIYLKSKNIIIEEYNQDNILRLLYEIE